MRRVGTASAPRGFGAVYRFTLRNQLRSRGYRVMTWLICILCLLLPASIMPLVEWLGGDTDTVPPTDCHIQTVFVVDDQARSDTYQVLQQIVTPWSEHPVYQLCDDLQQAQRLAQDEKQSVVLVFERGTDNQTQDTLRVLLPDHSLLDDDDITVFSSFLQTAYVRVALAKTDTDTSILQHLQTSEIALDLQAVESSQTEEEAQDPAAAAQSILSVAVPYVTILLLYFLILIYGQSVANSVIMEKNSKLMDLFLVSVDPTALVFGKEFAIITSAMLQVFLWMASLVLGFAGGTALVKWINPDTQMGLIQFFSSLKMFGGAFSFSSLILTLLMLLAGFVLYCSLSALGGAASEKPEDLSSTNVLFSMILVISFLSTFYTNDFMGQSNSTWQIWVPFTAVLVTPSRLLLGTITLTQAIGSLLVTVLFALLLTVLAGKVYRMMSFYRGKPPKPNELFKMLKNDN